jgi:hypothetical protein
VWHHLQARKDDYYYFWKQRAVRFRVSDHGLLPKQNNQLSWPILILHVASEMLLILCSLSWPG